MWQWIEMRVAYGPRYGECSARAAQTGWNGSLGELALPGVEGKRSAIERVMASYGRGSSVPGGSRFCATIRSENVRKPTGKRNPLRISQSAPRSGGGAR